MEEQLVYRITVVLKIVAAFRQALEKNGNRYNGSLVPNITSISDALIIPFPVLVAQVKGHDVIEPTAEELRQVRESIGAVSG